MKNVFLLAFFCLLFIPNLYSQTSKGSQFIGGGLSFSNIIYKYEGDYKNVETEYNVSPAYGYFINDNLAFGLAVGYNYNKHKYTDYEDNETTTSTYNTLKLSPFFGYYNKLNDKTWLLVHLNFAYGFGNQKNEGVSNKYNITYLGAGISPGISYFFTNRIGLECTIGLLSYSNSSVKNKSGPELTAGGFQFRLDLSTVFFRLKYHISN